MIITIPDCCNLIQENQEKIQALENILNVCRDGKHILLIPHREAHQLLKTLDTKLSESQKETLHNISQNVRFCRNSLLDTFPIHLEIFFSDTEPTTSTDNKIIQLHYKNFKDSNYLLSSILLVENHKDGDLYKLGANIFLFKKDFACKYSIVLEPVLGGGSTIFDVFIRKKEEKKIFLCIIDSDKKTEKSQQGNTAKRFNNEPQGLNKHYFFKILECQEIENIIPYKIIEEIITQDKDKDINEFRQLTYENRLFVDYKDKVGKNTLQKSLDILQKLSIQKQSEMTTDQDKLFLEISQIVASFGIAPKKRRSVT